MEERLTLKIHEIAISLKGYLELDRANIGLLSGKIGITLFFVHYARFTKKVEDEDFAYSIIQSLVDNRHYSGSFGMSYSTGIAGLGWFLEHINEIGFADVDTGEVLDDFDYLLGKEIARQLHSYNYDPLHGALGICHYLLNRKPNAFLDNTLQSAVDQLFQIATKKDGRISWLSFDYKKNTSIIGEYNLGLAHGNPGILSILSNLYWKKPILREQLKHMIEMNVSFILWCFEQRSDTGQYTSSFSSSFKEKEAFYNSRLGWCYGDLGVALALRSANTILNDVKISSVIRTILEFSTNRKSIAETMLFDAALCHGTSGVAHIYNSFYRELKLACLKEAADYWYLQSLAQANFADGAAGYKAYRQGVESVVDYGLLGGSAGIGLAYITYLNNDASWERSLFISH